MKQITPNQLVQLAKYLRVLIFGEPGTGKTWFGASGCLDPETSPVLFVEYRAQIASIRSNLEYTKAMSDGRLIILQLEKYTELNYIITWLTRGRGSVSALDEMMQTAGHADDVMPRTIVIDSLTELQRSEVMRRAGNAPNKFLSDVEAPQIQDWGSLLNQFTLLAHMFYELPYHVIFSGLETVDFGKAVIGEQPQIVAYRVAMQGQAKRQFPAYAMTLMRLERAPLNSKAYCLGYTQAIRAKTKEQTGMIPAKIADPTIPKLAKLLRGG